MRAVLAACIVLLLEAPALPDAASHLGKAIRLMQDRLFSEAAAEFEQALAADPNNDEVRIRYATCLFAQERNAEARKQFEIASAQNKDLCALAQQVATETAEPIKTGVSKAFNKAA